MAFKQLTAKTGFGLSKLLAFHAPKVSPIVLHHLNSDLPPFRSHDSFSSNSPPQLLNGGYRQFCSQFNDNKSSDYHSFRYAWTRALEEAQSNLKEARSNLQEARRNLEKANTYFDSNDTTKKMEVAKERHFSLVQLETEKLKTEIDQIQEKLESDDETVFGAVMRFIVYASIHSLYIAVVLFGLLLAIF